MGREGFFFGGGGGPLSCYNVNCFPDTTCKDLETLRIWMDARVESFLLNECDIGARRVCLWELGSFDLVNISLPVSRWQVSHRHPCMWSACDIDLFLTHLRGR